MRYMITGGTGSLGRALVRKILSGKKNEVVVYSRDEGKHALYFSKNPRVKTVIGDIRDFDHLNLAVKRYGPDFIIHAAALKRIENMELQPEESIKTNVIGSENVARAALFNDVKKCIFISTDKACHPVNVYGSSKFIAERIFTNYDFHSRETIFSSVRYGNVIASRGSFIPLWTELLSKGESIQVTSLEMTRFMFTLGEAVNTVLAALDNSEGGEVFVPQIKSYGMRNILKAIEILQEREISYDIIGLRPGEKLHEDMLAPTELPYTYVVPNSELLAVRPQYTKRIHNASWGKYNRGSFNSLLCEDDDVYGLVNLIRRGTKEANE